MWWDPHPFPPAQVRKTLTHTQTHPLSPTNAATPDSHVVASRQGPNVSLTRADATAWQRKRRGLEPDAASCCFSQARVGPQNPALLCLFLPGDMAVIPASSPSHPHRSIFHFWFNLLTGHVCGCLR